MSFGGAINAILNKIIPDRVARKSRKEILTQYGEPGDEYANRYCETWEVQKEFPGFPAKRIFINKVFKMRLQLAFEQLHAEGLLSEIKTFDGCYVIRNTRGSSLISLHSWAMAMDLNASVEKLGQTVTHWSDRFIEIMRAHVYWGGDFNNRKDPMHFSLYGE